MSGLLQTLPILAEMREIEGWFSEPEADLLAAAAADAVRSSEAPRRIVEVGSYCGRSTVVLGRVLQELGEPGDRVDAVDPHQGVVGAVGQDLWSGEPTLARFTRTIRDAGLHAVVRPVVARVQDVEWDGEPAAMVFVDGLHDYASVIGDITQLDALLVPGGLLACHDYCDGYPGVRRAVDQLVATGCYQQLARAESLVVLRKHRDLGTPPLHPPVEAALHVEGWFDRDELTALGWACARRPGTSGIGAPGQIVEVGCHIGQATGVLAAVAAGGPSWVHVFDPFDGVHGAVGEQMWPGEPTLERFTTSIRHLGVQDIVVTHPGGDEAADAWHEPISLLLVNHLHDYASAATDLRRFEPYLQPDATVIFHNYAEYWPGVRVLVDELVQSGRYAWQDQVGSLAVLRHVGPPPPSALAAADGVSTAGLPTRGGPRMAVLTMVADEAFFLPIWLQYYGQFTDPGDLYVLDHDSTDGSTSGSGFVRIPVHNPVTDWAWHVETVSREQERLLQDYGVVLVTDVDEIVVPDPAFGDLGRYVRQFRGDFVTCRGWEVLHDPDSEPPFDPELPVLMQRSRWFPNPAYSKPLLARTPMPWTGGFHARSDGLVNDDPRLRLIHLHRLDYDRCLERHRQRVARPWVAEQVAAGWGYQDRIVETEAFHHWFMHDTCWAGVPLVVEPIPSRWRTAF